MSAGKLTEEQDDGDMEEVEQDEEDDEEEEEEEAEESESEGEELCDGTGAHAWPTGEAMAQAIEKVPCLQQLLKGKRVLELGAGGSGIVGLAALHVGAAEVVLTDRAAVIPVLQRTLRERGLLSEDSRGDQGKVAAEPSLASSATGQTVVDKLDWGDMLEVAGQPRKFEVLLASDVLYNTKAGYGKLVHTIETSCTADGTLLLGCRWRKPGSERRFFGMLEERGFKAEAFDLQGTTCASAFCPVSLGWHEFGNPRCKASNSFLMEKISVAGVPTPVAHIDEEVQERLTDAEFARFEAVFTQLFLCKRQPIHASGAGKKRKAEGDPE